MTKEEILILIKDINLDAINEFADREQTEKANALLKSIFHKILVKYRIDEEGKKKFFEQNLYPRERASKKK